MLISPSRSSSYTQVLPPNKSYTRSSGASPLRRLAARHQQQHKHRPSLPPVHEVPQPTKNVETEISIIVTTWDDEGKCWYPVEAHGPIERELRKHAERKRRERMERSAAILETELSRERT